MSVISFVEQAVGNYIANFNYSPLNPGGAQLKGRFRQRALDFSRSVGQYMLNILEYIK
jgi:hypothetical protein